MGTPRFLYVNDSPSAPASFRSFFASAREALMSFQYPASLASSSGGVAHGVPGTWMPATSLTTAMRDSALLPS